MILINFELRKFNKKFHHQSEVNFRKKFNLILGKPVKKKFLENIFKNIREECAQIKELSLEVICLKRMSLGLHSFTKLKLVQNHFLKFRTLN